MKFLLSIFIILFLNGCAQSRSSIVATDLSTIGRKISDAKYQISKAEYEKAINSLDEAQKQIENKQGEILERTKEANSMADRLNYIEPKYAEAVGIIWRWRLIAIGSWILLVALFVARQYFPLLKLL